MKRRQLVRYAGAGFLAALGTGIASGSKPFYAQTGNAFSAKWLGHTCFLFTGGGRRILVNPFRPLGCTAGYRAPRVTADLVMVSSLLFDEGSLEGIPGNPQLLTESGAYDLQGLQVQGVGMPHDRKGGRRFGTNVIWRWQQAGINVVHMGGSAAPIDFDEQILIGRPDVLCIPVGGGPKAYNPREAKQAIELLDPKLIVPTHYRTQAADANACEIESLEEFLNIMDDVPVQRVGGDTLTVRPSDLPADGSRIKILSYRF
ncbi:MAG: MBL fold metallo-hydrolase [Cyanothece sp. SIO1E1]|nr:MBL fold metallo-hydrolase [Cyanothece sp. SIO1E1]